MLLTSVLWATGKPDFDAARSAAQSARFEDVEDESTRYGYQQEFDYWPDYEDREGDENALAALRKALLTATGAVEAMWTNRSDLADYDWHELGPVTAIIVAGESFGDDIESPAAQSIELFQTFGLARAAGFYR